MKNYISFTFYFTLIVVLALVGLHYLPPLTVGGYELRTVDLFSDIRKYDLAKSMKEELEDNVILPVIIKPQFIDTCKTGITCIEDYGDSTGYGLKRFYEKLGNRKELDRPVRIAFFGDSFTEADILTGDLRSLLQTEYGGCGVGFVPITSTTYAFRPTVIHSFKGWNSHYQTDSTGFDRKKQGIAGSYFFPYSNAYVELKGQTKYASHLDTCQVSTIYYRSSEEVELKSIINKEFTQLHNSSENETLQAICVEGEINNIRWVVNKGENAVFYGVAMDGKQGVSLDNLSVRGTNGLTLRNISESTLQEFNAVRPYDLIILQYGLNIATQYGKNYDYYQKGLLSSIEHLKKCFPEAAILMIGVSDRNYKTSEGNYKTMPGVKNLLLYQQAIAMESGIAFWNLFEAMGGEESMKRLVESKPSKANLDYSHINFRGGEYLAELLAKALIYGKEQYEERRKYDDE